MKIFIGILALTLMCEVGLQAQLPSDPPGLAPAAHVHGDSAPPIDGASNPELIPDLTAYRLFFVSIANSTNPSDEEKHRHRAYLNRVGLSDVEATSVDDVMTAFARDYESLIRKHNESVKLAIARDEVPDVAGFLATRDALVQAVRDSLKSVLSSEATSRLDVFVQAEKKRMKIQR